MERVAPYHGRNQGFSLYQPRRYTPRRLTQVAVMDGQSFVAVEGGDNFAANGMGLAEKKALLLLEPGDGGALQMMVRNEVVKTRWSLAVMAGFVGFSF